MIRLDVEQGSRSWLNAKVGIPSASNFHRLVTPKTGKVSASLAEFAHELLAEQVLGRPLDDATTEFMQRGTIMEHAARKWYAFDRGCDIEQVGFLLTDDRRAGCSPDGLVGEDGGIEIKCFGAKHHMGMLLGEDIDKIRCQIQGALWITDRKWWDLVLYNPDLPSIVRRFEPDTAFIATLAGAVTQLHSYLDESKLKLQREHGLFEDFEAPTLKIA